MKEPPSSNPLVQRLRNLEGSVFDRTEAADEIERLERELDEARKELHTALLGGHMNEARAEIDRLRAALEKIADPSAWHFDDEAMSIAREALKEKP